MDHDVIVVGTRAAGAATAMLLARAGLRVLAVDRARFPSDTLSTHQVQVPGIARLRRWGVLDRIAAVTPAVPTVRLDTGRRCCTGAIRRSTASTRSTGRGARCSTRPWSTPPARRAPRSAKASRSKN